MKVLSKFQTRTKHSSYFFLEKMQPLWYIYLKLSHNTLHGFKQMYIYMKIVQQSKHTHGSCLWQWSMIWHDTVLCLLHFGLEKQPHLSCHSYAEFSFFTDLNFSENKKKKTKFIASRIMRTFFLYNNLTLLNVLFKCVKYFLCHLNCNNGYIIIIGLVNEFRSISQETNSFKICL